MIYHSPFLLLSLLLLPGCSENRPPRDVERSFYYWKTSFDPGVQEQHVIQALKVKRLYIKFFDLVWKPEKNEPVPIAIIKFPKKYSFRLLTIIPTVFITNDCIKNMNDSMVIVTAGKIILLIKNIAFNNSITNIPEIQLDCDWNASTKENYFLLLQTIKKLITNEKKLLSATIRLYQYKYFKKMGVPPADRGLLMCYNMGNLKNPATRNSILESAELKKYMTGAAGYSLPLDIALPIFSWKVLFRNKIFAGLIGELPADSLTGNNFIKRSGNNFQVLQNTVISGYTFQTADIIRDETIAYNELITAADILQERLKTQHLQVVLYHIDSITLSKYSVHELETIFDHFH